MALPGNPYDEHTLKNVIPEMQKLISPMLASAVTMRQTPTICASPPKATSAASQTISKKLMKRRGAVEPVIGHIANEHRMDKNYLAAKARDTFNAVLAAAGYNFRLPLNWLKLFLCLMMTAMVGNKSTRSGLKIGTNQS